MWRTWRPRIQPARGRQPHLGADGHVGRFEPLQHAAENSFPIRRCRTAPRCRSNSRRRRWPAREYVKITFGSVLADLAADKFDIAMSGIGRTSERARSATFSKPYMRYGRLMMIRRADKGRFKSLAELDKPGIKIAYNKGGVNDRFANTMFKRATPTSFDSNDDDLLAGKVDAQVSNSAAAIYTARHDPRLAAMSPENIFNSIYVERFCCGATTKRCST
jgi:ABC-type amino acid transport substrate-binding protein